MTKQEIINQLSRPFSKGELRSRPGQGGMTFTYADASAVISRLNEVLGGAWSFEADLIQAQPAVIKGTLIVTFPDGETARRVDYGYPNGERDQEPIKSAQSDALRRTARMIGVGLYLYSKDPQAGTAAAARVAKPEAAAAPKRPAREVVDEMAEMVTELKADYGLDLAPKIQEAKTKAGVSDLADLEYATLLTWHKRVATKLAEAKGA